ncbi:MAG: AIR synthase related protein, partial [Pseudomonadota bacterium]
MPDTLTEPLLTSLAHGGGCGCKLAPNVLADILSEMPLAIGNPDLIVDAATSDDAAVYRVNETTAVVATTDFFTPIVDDPHTFGRIAASIRTPSNRKRQIWVPKVGVEPTCALSAQRSERCVSA